MLKNRIRKQKWEIEQVKANGTVYYRVFCNSKQIPLDEIKLRKNCSAKTFDVYYRTIKIISNVKEI